MATFPSHAREVKRDGVSDDWAFDPATHKQYGDGTPFACAQVTFVPQLFRRSYVVTAAEKAADEAFYRANLAATFYWYDVKIGLYRVVEFNAPPAFTALGSTIPRWTESVEFREYTTTTYATPPA